MKKFAYLLIVSYLRFFAQLALELHKPKIIGITGSVGKSSCREMIYAVLKNHVSVKVIEKGNSEIGIPLGIFGLSVHENSFFEWVKMLFSIPFRMNYLKNTEYLIVEMGIDEPFAPKNMSFLLTIVQPYIAIFLNAYAVHSMQFDPTVPDTITGKQRIDAIVKNIAAEKGKIITDSMAKIGIYSADNRYVRQVVSSVKRQGLQLLSFGKDKTNNVVYGDYQIDLHGTKFALDILLDKSINKTSIHIPGYLLPEVYREVIAASILTALSLNIPLNLIVKSLEKNFKLPPGRATLFEGIHDSIIIDSSYNASRHAVLAFLKMVSQLKKDTKRTVVLLFGDMRELGKETGSEHETVADAITAVTDYVYCVGQSTRQYVMPKIQDKVKSARWFENSVQLGIYAKKNLPDDAIVLVKGSQNTIFLEEAIKFLLLKKSDEKLLCRQTGFWMRKKSHSGLSRI